jgi:hypothetical protein
MRSERSWRVMGVIAIALGLVSFVLSNVLQWTLESGGDSPTAVISANPSAWLVAGFSAVLGPLLWAGGLLVVIGVVRERGWVLTTVGGTISAIGLTAGVGHLALFFGVYGDLAAAGASHSATQALLDADNANPLGNLLLIVFLVGFCLGPVVLTVGLRRAALVPVWLPVIAVIAAVTNFVGGPVAGIVQLIALLVVFVPLAVLLVRPGPFLVGRRSADAAPVPAG